MVIDVLTPESRFKTLTNNTASIYFHNENVFAVASTIMPMFLTVNTQVRQLII